MSYNEKIGKTRDVIDGHNQVAKNKIDYDKFITSLQDAGGTTDEALKCCTWEDLEKFGLPTLIAKQVASVFRAKDEKKVINEARAQAMTSRELFERYDPRSHDNFVGRRLTELAKGKPCLVYAENETVNVITSAKLLDELRDGYPARETVLVDGRPFKVYHIGERPDQFAFENPLYPGTLLRPDETCDHTNQSWSDIGETVRVLLYLAVKNTRELRINGVDDAHNVFSFLGETDQETKVRKRYPVASVLYDDLEKQGRLPTLKLSRSRPGNDPFYSSHKRF